MLFAKSSLRSYLKLILLFHLMAATSVLAVAPANDDFANAIVIAGVSGTINSTNIDATSEVNEPSHGAAGTPDTSIWYKWVAPNTDDVDFDTDGSDFDSALAVYTGTALNNLVQIGSNDDGGGLGLQSRVTFTPIMSETYYIAIDGFLGDTGNVTLNFAATPPFSDIEISGVVKLPMGHIAPSGGLDVYMIANDNFRGNSDTDFVNIAAGTNSIAYSLTVSVSTNNEIVTTYTCNECEDYVAFGFHSNSGTTYNAQLLTPLTGSIDHTNIDLTLITGDTISGRISLFGNDVAPVGGVYPFISAFDINNFIGYSYTTAPFIAEGESFFDYKFTVPTIGGATWRLEYACFGCDPYFQNGYYSDNGTVDEISEATLLVLDSGIDNPNKDLVILREDDSCFVIKASNGNVINFCL